MKVGMVIGSTGNCGPTLGIFRAKVSRSTTRLLALIIIATMGLHTGVDGIDEVSVSKIDDIKWYSPEWKNKNLN
jgi:hypothetical protein